MATMALCIMMIQSRGFPVPQRQHWARFLVAGLTGYTFYQLGFVLGLDRTSVFSSSLLVATSPLFTMLILAAIGERPPAASWIGVAIAVTGVAVFLVEKRGGDRSLEGDLLSLMAAISFAAYGIVNRPLTVTYSPAVSTAYAMTLGSIPLILLSVPAATRQDWNAIPPSSWTAVGFMVIFPVYLAYILWNFGIQRRGAAIASSFGLLVPILSGVLSAAIFNEQFGFAKLMGGGLVLMGLLTIRLSAQPPSKK